MNKYRQKIALADMFKDELFLIPETNNLKIDGKYAFPLLFLMNNQAKNALNEDDITFVNSILKQIPNEKILTIEDIGIININNQPTSVLKLVNQFKPKFMIDWGCESLLQGCALHQLQPIFLGELAIIRCQDLAQMKQNKESKLHLWQSMKVIFNIP